MALKEYRRRRDFARTPEPKPKKRGRRRKPPIFVIQEHHARRLHFDLRLEEEGVLKSWAITREPSEDIHIKRLAIETEDHPLDYARFEGEIPEGEYGAGSVRIWDQGTFVSAYPLGSAIDQGRIDITLQGERLNGRFILVRLEGRKGAPSRQTHWLFFKTNPKVQALHIPPIHHPRGRPKYKDAG